MRKCFRTDVQQIAAVAPPVAESLSIQEDAFVKFAGVAKAIFPDDKPLRYPSEPGTIGVAPIVPCAVNWKATASSSYPCYTSYNDGTWEIDLTAGTIAYLLGDSSGNYFKGSVTDDAHSMVVIAKDGIVEFGTTPKINQIHYKTEVQDKYGPICTHPLMEIPAETGKQYYQYPTLGMIPLYHNFGSMLRVYPNYTGSSKIALLGLVFYEHDFWGVDGPFLETAS